CSTSWQLIAPPAALTDLHSFPTRRSSDLGVGKSSLINTILGTPLQETKRIREGDDRGRHTTTTRQLIVVPGGGVLIDTPGMRELDRKSTRLNSSHQIISYAVFCLKTKNNT